MGFITFFYVAFQLPTSLQKISKETCGYFSVAAFCCCHEVFGFLICVLAHLSCLLTVFWPLCYFFTTVLLT